MNQNLYEILYKNFKSDLDRTCLEIPNYKKISFRDLDILSAHFASFLNSLGLKKGDRMICQIDKSLSAIGLYLGCLRTGVIYTPLNTSYTKNEVEYFINNIEPKLFVCRPESKDIIENICAQLNVPSFIAIGTKEKDPVLNEILSTKPLNIFENCSDQDIAAILFTSGTTGKSKGAMITHANLSSNALALREIWGFTSEDVLLHALPIFHVHGLFVALNTALLSASKIIFLEKFNIEDVVRNLSKSTVMMGVPTYYNRLVNEVEFKSDSYNKMRLFISGSAPLTEKTFNEFKEKTNHSILERYGMTETGMITSNPLHGNRLEGTVGFPLPKVSIRAMKEGKILADNEKGVIEVKGPNVFRGYWRMEVIKGIRESAIIGVKHSDLGESPIAILVSESEDYKISDKEIIEILNEKIAKYKIPKLFIWINELPLNAMGKVQKKNLRIKYEKIFRNNIANNFFNTRCTYCRFF